MSRYLYILAAPQLLEEGLVAVQFSLLNCSVAVCGVILTTKNSEWFSVVRSWSLSGATVELRVQYIQQNVFMMLTLLPVQKQLNRVQLVATFSIFAPFRQESMYPCLRRRTCVSFLKVIAVQSLAIFTWNIRVCVSW
jgi:hypothetical protein